MRVPPFYAGFCLLLLLLFGYTKMRGLEYWPSTPGTGTSSSSGGTRGSSGGYFGASSSHK